MSFRDWIYIVALVGFSFGLATGANTQPVDGNSGSNQQPSTTNATPKAPPSIQDLLQSIASAIEAGNNKPQTAQERDNAERDLAAQEDMARWAKLMLVIGGAEICVTLIGIFLIWRTLIHTRDAARHAGAAVVEANRATKAAEDAVKVTEAMAKAQTRAYLTVTGATIKYRDGLPPAVSIKIKNTGQSPAYNVNGAFRLSRETISVETPEDKMPVVQTHALAQIIGGGSEESYTLGILDERFVIEDRMPRTMAAMAEGIVEYQDIFTVKTGEIDTDTPFLFIATLDTVKVVAEVRAKGVANYGMFFMPAMKSGWITDYRTRIGNIRANNRRRKSAGEDVPDIDFQPKSVRIETFSEKPD